MYNVYVYVTPIASAIPIHDNSLPARHHSIVPPALLTLPKIDNRLPHFSPSILLFAFADFGSLHFLVHITMIASGLVF